MPISVKKLRRLEETDTSNVSIDPVPDTYLHQEIQILGKRTFALDELKRWDLMDGYGNFNCEVTVEEITSHIMSLREQFKQEQSANFFEEQRDILQQNIINKFGVGGIIARNGFDTFQNIPQGVKDTFALGGDKLGGNVTTIFNARQKIYAQKKEEYTSKQKDSKNKSMREIYTNGKNSEGKKFAGDPKNKKSVGSEFTREQLDKDGCLVDAYTGKTKKGSETSPDHIVSISEFHKNGGFMLSDIRKADFATDKDNLASTSRDINQSLNDFDKEEWINKKSSGREITNEEYFKIDKNRMDEKIKQGKEATQKHLPNTTEKAWFYGSNAALTGIGEGAKMGFRQMVASFIREVINAVFDEIRDYCARIKKLGEKWYHELGERLKRIGMKIAAKWKSILEAGRDGLISGFCSNIVTVIINIFVTTAKNIVRLIREGFFSLVKAIKMLLKPPPEMTRQQVFHEAGKIIITGATVTFGILAEEAIDKFPPMAVIKKIPIIGELLTDIILGLLIALVTSLALWGWDKLDIFGANREMQHKFVMDVLEKERKETETNHHEWLETIKQKDIRRYEMLKAELDLA